MALTGDAFCMYDTPTFKTEVLRLVSNEGRVKHRMLLLANTALPQPSLRCILLLGPHLLMASMANAIKHN